MVISLQMSGMMRHVSMDTQEMQFYERILMLSDSKLAGMNVLGSKSKSEGYRHMVRILRQRAWINKLNLLASRKYSAFGVFGPSVATQMDDNSDNSTIFDLLSFTPDFWSRKSNYSSTIITHSIGLPSLVSFLVFGLLRDQFHTNDKKEVLHERMSSFFHSL